MTSVRLDVAALGKGFQRRTGRMEIRDNTGQLRWVTIDDNSLASTPPLRAAQ